MKRAKYLQDMDSVQDAITKLKDASMESIMAETNLSYGAVARATMHLRNLDRIRYEYWGRKIVFHPN